MRKQPFLCMSLCLVCVPVAAHPQNDPHAVPGAILASPAEDQRILQPSGTALTVRTPGDFSGRFSQPFRLLQNDMTVGKIETMQGARAEHPNSGSLADVVTCGQLVPIGAAVGQANCFSAFQYVFSSVNPVGFYARSEPAVDDITEWGANFNLSDTDDITGIVRRHTTEFAAELDVNVSDRTTAGAALLFGSIFTVQPANMGAIHLPLPHLYSGNRWTYGLLIDDGAISGPAISLGTVETSPPVSVAHHSTAAGSQYLQMNWRDNSGAEHASTLRVDARGTYHLNSQYGLTIDSGTLLTPSLAVSHGVPPGAGLQHQRVALGCVTAPRPGSTCTSAPIQWTLVFADTKYTLSCSLEATTGTPVISSVEKRPDSFTVTVAALTSVAATGTADCIAMHDAVSDHP